MFEIRNDSDYLAIVKSRQSTSLVDCPGSWRLEFSILGRQRFNCCWKPLQSGNMRGSASVSDAVSQSKRIYSASFRSNAGRFPEPAEDRNPSTGLEYDVKVFNISARVDKSPFKLVPIFRVPVRCINQCGGVSASVCTCGVCPKKC